MQITLEIPDYDASRGLKCHWEAGFTIHTSVEDGVIRIQANKAGLLSLANHLVNLAQEKVAAGAHLHLDEMNSLEEASNELIIEKVG